MKFEEILPLLREGKKFMINEDDNYISIMNSTLVWKLKKNSEYLHDFYGHDCCLDTGWEEYIEKPEVKERKVVDCFNNDFFQERIADQTEDHFLTKGWETINKEGSRLKMVKYED